MNFFRDFKTLVSSRSFPRYGIFLFIFLSLVLCFICGTVFNLPFSLQNLLKFHLHNAERSITISNDKSTYTIDVDSDEGNVNPFLWGINAADKHLLWAGSKALEQRLRDAQIKIVRVGAIQYANYALGHSMCTSLSSCDFSTMDACLKAIFDAGAEPLFVVVAYPGGIIPYDWQGYANFMKRVVTRYNIDLVLGKRIRYWEMWNEPTDEPDGRIPTQQLYGEFVNTVGGAMKLVDPTIKLIAPAAPYADFGSNGWLNYVAQNTGDFIDILSWHDYGRHDANDQTRLTYTKTQYYDNIRVVADSNNFVNTVSGKRFGAAITEYNMAGQPLEDGSTAQFHSNYNAVFVASAIINAMKAGAQLFTFFTLAQSGTNLLGILNPTNGSYAPFTTYYTFYLFGNHMGKTLLKGTGDSGLLEYVASKSADGKVVYIVAVNKDVENAQVIHVKMSNSNSGNYRVYELDANTQPLTGLNRSYQAGQFTYTLPPLSVTAFEIPETVH